MISKVDRDRDRRQNRGHWGLKGRGNWEFVGQGFSLGNEKVLEVEGCDGCKQSNYTDVIQLVPLNCTLKNG